MVKSKDISDTKNIIKAAANLVADRVGFKKKERTETKKTFWRKRKRKRELRIKKELGQADRLRKGEIRNELRKERILRSHKIKEKWLALYLKNRRKGQGN